MRYPKPLQAGDLIAVTSPSSGVQPALEPRRRHCIERLRQLGYEVLVGACMDGSGPTSAPAADRAAELMTFLTDPRVRAVVPPWGGELAIDLLPLLDFDAIQAADPPWLVGYSDLTTVMFPLTLRTGVATLHGCNLMDTPYAVPSPLLHWLDAATTPVGGSLTQGAASAYQGGGYADFGAHPDVESYALNTPGGWRSLDESVHSVSATGRLIGGCLETLSMLPGTPYGDLAGFARSHAPEGLIVYLEVAESDAFAAARMFHHLVLAGWFDAANAVLIGRTGGSPSGSFTQLDAVRHALGELGVPVLYDLDLGHVPPQLALVNGALATVELTGSTGRLVQHLS